MNEFYFTFRSMTAAQQGSMELSMYGIPAAFLRTPRMLSDLGCGYAVRVGAGDALRSVSALRKSGIQFEKIIQMAPGGSWKEIWL